MNPLRIVHAGLLLGVATPALADTTLIFEYTPAPEAAAETIRVLIRDDRLAFVRGKDERPTLVFDKATQALTYVNHRDGVVTVFTEPWAQQARKRLEKSRKEMQKRVEAQTKNMTPQERSMSQQGRMGMQMMGGFMGGGMTQAAPRNYVPALGTVEIKGRACQRVDVFEGFVKVEQQCTTSSKTLGLPERDAQTLTAMGELVRKLSKLGAFSFGFDAPQVGGGYNGVAIARVALRDGKPISQSVLTSVQAGALDGQALEIPEGYLQAKIPLP